MPPKASKRTTGLNDDGSWGDSQDRPRKKTRVSIAHIDDQDENHSSQANKQFSSWVAWQTKFSEKEKTEKRQFADDFTQKLKSKQTKIQDLIATSKHEFAATEERYSKLTKAASDDYKPNSKTKSRPQTATSREEHHLFKSGQQVFKNCRDLIAVHGRAKSKASQDNDKLGLPREQWKEDVASVQELLVYGRQHGENIVECIIVPTSCNEEKSRLMTPDIQRLSETGKMAVNLYRKSTGSISESGSTWGELAKGQAGGFGRILNDLADV
ncbi:hypothetical protein Daus18300_002647 [Diaporthe australafricana]|uniref:Uncharacterized protein n=1 Tax=Diaporthe australafricana TaxID=127596 RepID=A0ABR3XM16_9PEZI